MTTISKSELTAQSYSVKDNSVRGITTKYTTDIKAGDQVVINNHFATVTEQ